MAEWVHELQIGQWFETEDNDSFEIVGLDVKNEVVLVQRFDGTLEEFDFEVWSELRAKPCAPSEDVSGALDDLRGDSGGSGWQDPLDFLDTRP